MTTDDPHRRWTQARSRSPRSRWWEKQTRFGDVGVTVAFLATALLVFVDLALRSPPSAQPTSSRWSWQLMALLVLFLANAEVLSRILWSRAPRRLSLAWRIGTALACGVPLLGLFAFAAAAQRMAAGSGAGQEEPLSLEAPSVSPSSRLRSLADRWTRMIVREWSAIFYFVTNLIVLFWIVSTLPGKTWGTMALSAVLHAAAASGLAVNARAEARTARAVQVPPAVLLVPASLTLFTVPFVPFLGFVLYVFAVPRMAERSLPRALQEKRTAAARSSNPPLPVRELTDTDRYLLWTYALKFASLIPDGTALSWLAFRVTAGSTSQRGIVQAVITGIVGVSLALGGAGLLLMLLRTLQNRMRVEGRLSFLDRHPAHHYLAASQLSFATGLLLGGPLFEGDGREVGAVVALAALCGTAVSFPRLFLFAPGGEHRTSVRAGWTVFFCILAISGAQWATGHESRETMLWLFRVCIAFLPFAVPLFILRQLLVHLLRPFSPAAVRDRAWSRSIRRTVLFLTVTALLPLGGLAVPAWIWVRYRFWPDFEREWQERASRSPGAGRRS